MKNLINIIRNKTVLVLNYIVGFILFYILLTQNDLNFWLMIMIYLTTISLCISTYFSKNLEKYNCNLKIWHYILFFILNVILLGIYFYIEDVIYLDNDEGYIFQIIYLIINFIYWLLIVILNKKSINKFEFFLKTIKYTIPIFILPIYISLLSYFYYQINYVIILSIILLHLSVCLSPIFDYICKKTNKSFNLTLKIMFIFIPIILFLSILIFSVISSELYLIVLIPFTILSVIILIIYILYCILFFVLNKHKYIEKNKSKWWKVILIILSSIIVFITSTMLFTKILLVWNTNLLNKQKIEKNNYTETIINNIKIEPKEIKEDNILNLDFLQIENQFNDYNLTYISSNMYGFKSIKNNKSVILRIFRMDNDVSLYYGNIFSNIKNEYEYYYKFYSSKTKVTILDSIQDILFSSLNAIDAIWTEINFIEYKDFKGFIIQNERGGIITNLYNVKNNQLLQLISGNYTKTEIIDLISTIRLNENYPTDNIIHENNSLFNGFVEYNKCNNQITGDIILNAEQIKNLHYPCQGSISINNNKYELNNSAIYYDEITKYYEDSEDYETTLNNILILTTDGENNKLQIINKNGEEILNIKYSTFIKEGNVYKPFGVKVKDNIIEYYEYINGEYVYKTVEKNF